MRRCHGGVATTSRLGFVVASHAAFAKHGWVGAELVGCRECRATTSTHPQTFPSSLATAVQRRSTRTRVSCKTCIRQTRTSASWKRATRTGVCHTTTATHGTRHLQRRSQANRRRRVEKTRPRKPTQHPQNDQKQNQKRIGTNPRRRRTRTSKCTSQIASFAKHAGMMNDAQHDT